MLESMVEWMSYPLYYAFDGAAPPPRAGAAHATIYPYGPFPAGDGKIVMLGLQNEREWAVFCDEVLRQPELASGRALLVELAAHAPRATRCARSSSTAFAAARPPRRSIERLDAAQIANARMNDMHDVWAHPQLAARERWVDVDTPAGPVPALAAAGTAARRRRRAWTRCRRSAQHTDAILRELGYGDADIARLRAASNVMLMPR